MIKDRFEGDLRIILTPEGADIKYIGGQPIMDQGLETMVHIDLFTKRTDEYRNTSGYWGNLLEENPINYIGSDFISRTLNQPITIKTLANNEQEADKALNSRVYGKKEVTANNVSSNRIDYEITIHTPSADVNLLLQTTNGLNWINQALKPAYENI